MAIIKYNTTDEWHALRSQNVGASEVGALFGMSPWTTKWKLYMQKTGQLPDNGERPWMTRGRHFEPAIASYAREQFDLDTTKVDTYWTDDACKGLGASLDYTLQGDVGVPVEIKWVESYDGWDWTGDELTTIPDHYLLQVQHQMACTSAPRGMLLAFIGGAVKRMVIPRSDGIINMIRDKVTGFWSDVGAQVVPQIDFHADSDAIHQIARSRPLRSVALRPSAQALFEIAIAQKAILKEATAKAEAAEAELVKLVLDEGIGNDGKAVATCGDYRMTLSQVADNPGKVVTPDMLGTIINARRGYLRTTISMKKDK